MARPVGPPPKNGVRAITSRPATSASAPSQSGGESDPTLAMFAKFLEQQGYEVTKRASGEKRRGLQDFFRCVTDTSPYNRIGGGLLPRVYGPDQAKKRLEEVYKTSWSTVEKASMGEGHGIVGGYTVPLEMSLAMMQVISEESFVYPRALVVPMASKTLELPKVNVETAQAAGTSPFLGGLLFQWGSGQKPTETEPTFGKITLDAWDLLGYCVLSNQFLADTGPEGEAALVQVLGKAAAFYTELAFFQGIGAAAQMPLGIINAPGTISVSRNTPAHVKVQDIATMAAKLLPSGWRKAIWAVSPSTWVDIAQIATFGLNQYSGTHDGHIGTMLSQPIFSSEKLSILGSAGDVALFDPSLYVIGNRQEVIVDVSTHDAFKNNQTTFRVWLRMDAKPWNSKAITLQDASSTVSPFVVLV